MDMEQLDLLANLMEDVESASHASSVSRYMDLHRSRRVSNKGTPEVGRTQPITIGQNFLTIHAQLLQLQGTHNHAKNMQPR